MDIGMGLPSVIPGTPGDVVLRWAQRSEERGFSGLATIDRIAYPSYDSLTVLAAAAGVTERIGLVTNILLGPTRNPVMLAKEAASLDRLSGGRFILGVAVGSRPDDFEATGQDFAARGRRWDRDLEIMHRAWAGEPVEGADRPVGPKPTREGGVPLLIGGMGHKAIERTIRWGIGWTVGGAPPEQGAPFGRRVRAAWAEAGRPGQPKLVALTYFGLSDRALQGATSYLSDYYGDFGPRIAQYIPKDAASLRETVRKFEDAGFDELFLDPTVPDLDEVDRAADVVFG